MAQIPMASGPVRCWEWRGSRNPEGYGNFGLARKTEKAHRVAYRLFNGPIPVGMLVMHKCDNPPCCNPEHLKLGTWQENAQDKEEKGRGNHARGPRNGAILYPERLKRGDENVSRKNPELLPRGEHHWTVKKPECVARGQDSGTAKLVDDDVVEMRRLFRLGVSTPDLADKYGLDTSSTYAALRGWTWSHVPDPIPMGTRQSEPRARGERVNTAKLTSDDVVAIRRAYAAAKAKAGGGRTKVSYDLADQYGVSRGLIPRIISGECWAHIPL